MVMYVCVNVHNIAKSYQTLFILEILSSIYRNTRWIFLEFWEYNEDVDIIYFGEGLITKVIKGPTIKGIKKNICDHSVK